MRAARGIEGNGERRVREREKGSRPRTTEKEFCVRVK